MSWRGRIGLGAILVCAALAPARPARGDSVVGRRVAIRNPFNEQLDPHAQVTGLLPIRPYGTPWANVRFSDGSSHPFPVARLELVGQPLEHQRQAVAAQQARVKRAIRVELGLEPQVPMVIVRGSRLRSLAGQITGGSEAGTLAFYSPQYGAVYVHPDLALFTPIPVHEYIHSLAAVRFRISPWVELNEGITEYFTQRVATRQLGASPIDAEHPYFQHARVAARIAEVIGPGELQRIFFHGDIRALENAIDARLGPRTMREVGWELQYRNPGKALQLLGGDPSPLSLRF